MAGILDGRRPQALAARRARHVRFGPCSADSGRTICRDFYFPYARKIWGLDPHELDGEQARRRVAAGSLAKLVRKVLSTVPGIKQPGKGRFYYPSGGFGQISQAYGKAAQAAGATIHLNTRLQRIELRQGMPATRLGRSAGQPREWSATHVFSTIPLPVLARSLNPAAPSEVMVAADRLRYRSMILVYLQLQAEQFTEFDAHYFPEASLRITRLSEPKHYGLADGPTTVLCAELPCDCAEDGLATIGRTVGGTGGRGSGHSRDPDPCPHFGFRDASITSGISHLHEGISAGLRLVRSMGRRPAGNHVARPARTIRSRQYSPYVGHGLCGGKLSGGTMATSIASVGRPIDTSSTVTSSRIDGVGSRNCRWTRRGKVKACMSASMQLVGITIVATDVTLARCCPRCCNATRKTITLCSRTCP